MFGFERDNPGFTVVEILIVILIVLFLGLSALVIDRAHHAKVIARGSSTKTVNTPKATVPNDTPPQGTPPVNLPSTSTQATTAPPSTTSTIKISSLGAEITVPNSMAGLTYSTKTASNGTITVNFSTPAITDDAASCAASSGQGAFDSIIRASGVYPTSAPSNEGLIKQESGYYLAFILPSGPCASGLSASAQSLLDEQSEDFYSALSSVQVY